MQVHFNNLNIGDFFIADPRLEKTPFLYQKITEKHGYNAVLLNTGELSQLYISDKTIVKKVEVQFEIRDYVE